MSRVEAYDRRTAGTGKSAPSVAPAHSLGALGDGGPIGLWIQVSRHRAMTATGSAGRHPTMLGMNLVIIAIFGVLAVVGVNALAPRLGVAPPLLLVLLGVGVCFIPRVGPIDVNPKLILAGILPPLLYSTAVAMPTMEFRRDFRTISVLSVVLVAVSVIVVGLIMHLLIPGLDLALGIALGAILSPTDAVATSIVRKAGVSQRVVERGGSPHRAVRGLRSGGAAQRLGSGGCRHRRS